MKVISSILLIVMVFCFAPLKQVSAQDADCDDILLADVEAHEVAMYLFTELERPGFTRQDYVIAIIIYANKLTIEQDTCGLGVQARLLSWALEVYRVESNFHLKVIEQEKYDSLAEILFDQRAGLYEAYCIAYPIACEDGAPLEYNDLLESLDPPSGGNAR